MERENRYLHLVPRPPAPVPWYDPALHWGLIRLYDGAACVESIIHRVGFLLILLYARLARGYKGRLDALEQYLFDRWDQEVGPL